MSEIDVASSALFTDAASLPPAEQIDLATYLVDENGFRARGHEVEGDAARARIMRSTVMKPESADTIAEIEATLERLVRSRAAG